MDPFLGYLPAPGNNTMVRCDGPTPDLVYARLRDMDLRLRQLEEKQRPAQWDEYFSSDLRRGARPTQEPGESSRTKESRSKGTLMDRVRFLESRISQLSFDLGKACTPSAPTGVTKTEAEEIAWLMQPRPVSDTVVPGARHSTRGRKTMTSSDEFQGQIPKGKEKTVESVCRSEKRRMARTRIYKKWFHVGC